MIRIFKTGELNVTIEGNTGILLRTVEFVQIYIALNAGKWDITVTIAARETE